MILCTVYEYFKSELAIKLYIDTDKGEWITKVKLASNKLASNNDFVYVYRL